MSKRSKELKAALLAELTSHANPYRMALKNGWSFGLVYRVLGGGWSPRLYRQVILPTRQPRPRLNIETDPAQYDKQAEAHGMSRVKFLDHMLKVDRGDGFGELDT